MSIREKFEDDLAADPLLGARSEVDIITIAKEKRDMLRGIISGHRIGFSITEEIQDLIDKLNKVIGGK